MWLDQLVESTWQNTLGGVLHELEKEKNQNQHTQKPPKSVLLPFISKQKKFKTLH